MRSLTKRCHPFSASVLLALACAMAHAAENPETASGVGGRALAKEVAAKGWIVYSTKTPHGDYDVFLSRPDGSSKRNLTQTPDFNEYGARFSPDSARILYRRHKAGTETNHDRWGAMGTLVIANADGSNPAAQGGEGEWPWASWSPDGKRFACLYKREGKITIVEADSKKVIKTLPRQGIFQQLFWSADGKRLCGTANINGQDWNILTVDLETGKATLITRALNCTPDWFQTDPNRVIYSNRTPGLGSENGWTMLMQATADGKSRTLVYGERDRHIYYGCTSPDDKYVIFSRPPADGRMEGPMTIVRLADTPIIPGDFKELKALYPNAKDGPAFLLEESGFEPHWTYVDVGGKTDAGR